MVEITGLERALTYLNGEKPDKMPIWLESVYLAWKYSGVPSLREYVYDGKAIARGHIAVAEKFRVDITGVNTDQWVMYEILGAEVEILDHVVQAKIQPWRYKPDHSIYDRFIEKVERIEKNIEEFDPRKCKRAEAIFEAWKIVAEKIGNKVLLRQGILGPAATLALTIGMTEVMRDVMIFPDLLPTLTRIVRGPLMEWTVDVAYKMVEAINFTNFCMGFSGYDKSILSPDLREWLAALDLEYLNKVRSRIGKDVPITTHVCSWDPDLDFIYEKFGKPKLINELQFYAPGSTYPLEKAVKKFGDKIPLCAGIDHLGPLFSGTPKDVELMVKNSIELGKNCISFALGPGCGLSPNTPEENLLKISEVRDKYGRYK
ncbi:MAG: uroporphyrinogen decarboxylase family protein [Nitrososphaerota archaeon]